MGQVSISPRPQMHFLTLARFRHELRSPPRILLYKLDTPRKHSHNRHHRHHLQRRHVSLHALAFPPLHQALGSLSTNRCSSRHPPCLSQLRAFSMEYPRLASSSHPRHTLLIRLRAHLQPHHLIPRRMVFYPQPRRRIRNRAILQKHRRVRMSIPPTRLTRHLWIPHYPPHLGRSPPRNQYPRYLPNPHTPLQHLHPASTNPENPLGISPPPNLLDLHHRHHSPKQRIRHSANVSKHLRARSNTSFPNHRDSPPHSLQHPRRALFLFLRLSKRQ